MESNRGAIVKLRQIVLALALTPLAAAAFADDAHHPDEKAQVAPSKPAAKQPAEAMGKGAMQANMKRMQEQMAQIRAASDPKERARLMDEHMKTMQESMSKMDGMMGSDSSQRMDMMQMMMRQMMEHDAAGHAAPK